MFNLGRRLFVPLALSAPVWIFAFLGPFSLTAFACGATTDCTIEGGTYRIEIPSDSVKGAVVFFHGWQSTAQGQLRNRPLVEGILALGFAFVAPQGEGKTWSYPSSPSQRRDEFAFTDALRKDLIETHAVAPDRILASGFSMGGSMAWSLACDRGDVYAGFVPIAGAFWEPLPEECTSATDAMIHVHGGADRTVPMEGRPIGQSYHQGDVEESLAILLGEQGWVSRPDFAQDDTRNLTCKSQTAGPELAELCMHAGGHSIRAEWVIDGIRKVAAFRGWTDRPVN